MKKNSNNVAYLTWRLKHNGPASNDKLNHELDKPKNIHKNVFNLNRQKNKNVQPWPTKRNNILIKTRLICDFTFKHFGRASVTNWITIFSDVFEVSWMGSFSSSHEGKTELKKLTPHSALVHIPETTKGEWTDGPDRMLNNRLSSWIKVDLWLCVEHKGNLKTLCRMTVQSL